MHPASDHRREGPAPEDRRRRRALGRWEAIAGGKATLDADGSGRRGTSCAYALLDFIADFANWDNSTVPAYLETSRALTQAAHEALGGEPGTRPLVVDPFAGGGSIPLEALRVGADAFASDLNPVAVLLNKVVLEYIPKYGQRLADEVRKWGAVDQGAGREGTGRVLPEGPRRRDADRLPVGADDPCEGPGCGAEVPLMRSLWLAKKARSRWRCRSCRIRRRIALISRSSTMPRRRMSVTGR